MSISLIIIKEKIMIHYKRKPTSPGEILREEFLAHLGITQKQLADHLGCDYKVINRIVNEKASVSPEMAMRLACAFETTPDFWLNAQNALDLWKIDKKENRISSLLKHHPIDKAV